MYTFNIRRLYCVTNTKIYSPKCLLFGYNNATNENLINCNIDQWSHTEVYLEERNSSYNGVIMILSKLKVTHQNSYI